MNWTGDGGSIDGHTWIRVYTQSDTKNYSLWHSKLDAEAGDKATRIRDNLWEGREAGEECTSCDCSPITPQQLKKIGELVSRELDAKYNLPLWDGKPNKNVCTDFSTDLYR